MTNAVKMGRPSSFNDRLVERLLQMATQGATDAQMAKTAGVGYRTFMTWKAQYPDFQQALKQCKLIADELVEASLYQRATGYSHKAIKIFCTKGGEIVTERYIEHYPPDTTACIFWLKNRQPDKWRDVHKIDVTAEVKHILPSAQEARQILDADYAVLPAPDVKIEEL